MENTGNTILLINDEPTLCRSLALLLRQADYSVIIAANESEALKQLLAGDFDLVCLDLKWKQRNEGSLWSVREISQRCPETPILFLSDSPQEEAILEKIMGLQYESLLKPLDPSRFLDRVDALVSI